MKKNTFYSLASGFSFLIFLFFAFMVWLFPTALSKFDLPLIQTIHSLPDKITPFFIGVTKTASAPNVILLTTALVLLFWYNKQRPAALWLLVNTFAVTGIFSFCLKQLLRRTRPTILPHKVIETSFSFPSGHAVASMILYGTLFFITHSLVKNRNTRRLLELLSMAMILLIGTSRVFLGVHYPSDVLSGWLLGSSWLLLTYPFYAKKSASMKEKK